MTRPLAPRRHPGAFVFVPVADPVAVWDAFRPVAAVREEEGWALVVPADRAGADDGDEAGDGRFALISLGLQSGLGEVGLTAAVSAALARRGIACNVLAGLRHDHLLVPEGRADEAAGVLADLTWPPPPAAPSPGASGGRPGGG